MVTGIQDRRMKLREKQNSLILQQAQINQDLALLEQEKEGIDSTIDDLTWEVSKKQHELASVKSELSHAKSHLEELQAEKKSKRNEIAALSLDSVTAELEAYDFAMDGYRAAHGKKPGCVLRNQCRNHEAHGLVPLAPLHRVSIQPYLAAHAPKNYSP